MIFFSFFNFWPAYEEQKVKGQNFDPKFFFTFSNATFTNLIVYSYLSPKEPNPEIKSMISLELSEL